MSKTPLMDRALERAQYAERIGKAKPIGSLEAILSMIRSCRSGQPGVINESEIRRICEEHGVQLPRDP